MAPILVPGGDDQGTAYPAEVRAVFDAPGDNNSGFTGHWLGSVVTNDITVQPNGSISGSASMFLDNNAGQVWEFYCNGAGEWGMYDKTSNVQAMNITAGGAVAAAFSGSLAAAHNTLDDGAGRLTTTGDVHAGVNVYVAGNTVTSGGYASNVVTKTSNYSVGVNDSTVLANGASTVTLLDATNGLVANRIFTIKNIHASSCTVATYSSQTIDGSTTYTLGSQYKYVTVQSDGSNWFIIANN